MEKEEQSVKEKRIRSIVLTYYSRPDIRKAMLDFAKDREIAPSYMMESFGKRPNAFQYESDIVELAKKGATSFHCSEELWIDPLELSVEMTENQLNSLRKGWDLLIDVDSKYIDYSKIYADILIKILNQHGVKHVGVKFSGSKGFHIIVPWKAFPKKMSGKETKDMFPEWPRLICKYLSEKLTNEFRERVFDINIGKSREEQIERVCINCSLIAEKTNKVFLICPACKTESESLETILKRKRIIRCPNCSIEMKEVKKQEVYYCSKCNKNSKEFADNFKERIKKEHIEADIVLVSSRHLFRMPYSLHEKTSLASVVIDPDKVRDFDIKEAHNLKIKVKNFLPDSEEGEAANLLREALEYHLPEEEEESKPVTNLGEKKFQDITIKNLNPDLYPPAILTILKGMKSDGRKRALFILLNFFRSLKLSDEELKLTIEEWNKKNYNPLKKGYINSQLSWHLRTASKLPPNYDKSYYKDLGINPTDSEMKAKNPVSYVIKKAFATGNIQKK